MRVVEVSNIFSCCEVEFEGGLVEGRAQRRITEKLLCPSVSRTSVCLLPDTMPHCEDKMVDWWSQWLLGIHQRSIAAEQEWRKL